MTYEAEERTVQVFCLCCALFAVTAIAGAAFNEWHKRELIKAAIESGYQPQIKDGETILAKEVK